MMNLHKQKAIRVYLTLLGAMLLCHCSQIRYIPHTMYGWSIHVCKSGVFESL